MAQHAELVEAVAALYDLTPFRETKVADSGDRYSLACSRDAPKLAGVGDAQRPAGHHPVSFSDHVLDDVFDVRESGAVLLDELLDVFGATLQGGAVGLVGEIRFGEDLVRDVQFLVLPDLLDVAPECILVPLERHSLAPSFRSRWVVFCLDFRDEDRET